MNKYIVYKHTCPNGKVYIGLTCRDSKERWKRGSGYRNNPHFYNAIKKYGWDNIKHEILFSGLSKEDASDYERLLIFMHNSTDRRFGYNHETGGTIGYTHSADTRHVLSEIGKIKTGNLNNFYGRKHSDESKAKMSAAKKKNPNTKANARIGGLACAEKRKKAVLQFDLEGNLIAEYESATEASLKMTNGKNKFSHISAVCNKRENRNTCFGYIWRYKESAV